MQLHARPVRGGVLFSCTSVVQSRTNLVARKPAFGATLEAPALHRLTGSKPGEPGHKQDTRDTRITQTHRFPRVCVFESVRNVETHRGKPHTVHTPRARAHLSEPGKSCIVCVIPLVSVPCVSPASPVFLNGTSQQHMFSSFSIFAMVFESSYSTSSEQLSRL